MSYICSRYYRAPELIFGATDYTSQIGETRLIKRRFSAVSRRVVGGLRAGRAVAGATDLPGRQRRRPTRGDHQGVGDADPGANPRNEPQLH